MTSAYLDLPYETQWQAAMRLIKEALKENNKEKYNRAIALANSVVKFK